MPEELSFKRLEEIYSHTDLVLLKQDLTKAVLIMDAWLHDAPVNPYLLHYMKDMFNIMAENQPLPEMEKRVMQ